ncbi:gephyrin-like molybdotransferase receptor GlpR, partial [Streptomyces sp. 796.1]|uniref:divisome protein SepX/GlpR n=1 Tax=Streptomyces sp. 796.1 TaxID=3163029 RepID=UPI0039C9AC48
MSSSGLIYAVIVGAWAAYLVPMWLRRQDELNDARPTERFSTAIRLLSGRAAMERRYVKELDGAEPSAAGADDAPAAERAATGDAQVGHARDRGVAGSEDETDVVDVRAFAQPATMTVTVTDAITADPHAPAEGATEAPQTADPGPGQARAGGAGPVPGGLLERSRRAKVLARRRRTTVVLFLTFTAGAIVAAVGGVAFLWAPVGPAVLLSAYIVYLRVQERRRFAFTMDQRRAELAAQRLREQRRRTTAGPRPAAGQRGADRPPAGPSGVEGPPPAARADHAGPDPRLDRPGPDYPGPD